MHEIQSHGPAMAQPLTARETVAHVAGKISDAPVDTQDLLGEIQEAPRSLWTQIKGIFTRQVGEVAAHNLDYTRMSLASLKTDAAHLLRLSGEEAPQEYTSLDRFAREIPLPDLGGEDVSLIGQAMAENTLTAFETARQEGDTARINQAYGMLTNMGEQDLITLMAGRAMEGEPQLNLEDAMKLGKALYCGLISGLAAGMTPEVVGMMGENAFDYGDELSEIHTALTAHKGSIADLSRSIDGLDDEKWMDRLGEVGEGLRPRAKQEMRQTFRQEVQSSRASLDGVKQEIQDLLGRAIRSTSLSDLSHALEELGPYLERSSGRLSEASLFQEHEVKALKSAESAREALTDRLYSLFEDRLDALEEGLEGLSLAQMASRLKQLDPEVTDSLALRIEEDPFLSDSDKTRLEEKISGIRTTLETAVSRGEKAYASFESGFNALTRDLDQLKFYQLDARLDQLDPEVDGSLAQRLAGSTALSSEEKEDFVTLTQQVGDQLTSEMARRIDHLCQRSWPATDDTGQVDADLVKAMKALDDKGLFTDEFIAQVNGIFGRVDGETIVPLTRLEGEAREVVIRVSQADETATHRLFGSSWGSTRAQALKEAFSPATDFHRQMAQAGTRLFRGKQELLAQLPEGVARELGFPSQTMDSLETVERLDQTPVTRIIEQLASAAKADPADARAADLLAQEELGLFSLCQLELLMGVARGDEADFGPALEKTAKTLGLDINQLPLDRIDALSAKGFSGRSSILTAQESSQALVDNLSRSRSATLTAFKEGMAQHPDMAVELMGMKTASFFARLEMADRDIETKEMKQLADGADSLLMAQGGKKREFRSLDGLNVSFEEPRVQQAIANKLAADLTRVAGKRTLEFSGSRLSRLENALADTQTEAARDLVAGSQRLTCLKYEFLAIAGALQAQALKKGTVSTKAEIEQQIKAMFPQVFEGEPKLSPGTLTFLLEEYTAFDGLDLDRAKGELSSLAQGFSESYRVLDSFIQQGQTDIGVESQMSRVLYHVTGLLGEGQTLSARVTRTHTIEVEAPEKVSEALLGGTSVGLGFSRMKEGTMAITRTSVRSDETGEKNGYTCLVRPASETGISVDIGLAEGMISLGATASVMKAQGYIARFDSSVTDAEESVYGFTMGFIAGRPDLSPIDEIDFIMDSETAFGATLEIGKDVELKPIGIDGTLKLSAGLELRRQEKGSTVLTSSGNVIRTGSTTYGVTLEGAVGIETQLLEDEIRKTAEFETTVETRVVTTRDGSVDESTMRVVTAELGEDPRSVLQTLTALGGEASPELTAAMMDRLALPMPEGSTAEINCSITREAAQQISVLRRRAKALLPDDPAAAQRLMEKAMGLEEDQASYVPVEVVINRKEESVRESTIKPLLFVYSRTDALSGGFVDSSKFSLVSTDTPPLGAVG